MVRFFVLLLLFIVSITTKSWSQGRFMGGSGGGASSLEGYTLNTKATSLFPNPASAGDIITINTPLPASWTIFDSQGIYILSGFGLIISNTSYLKPGIYLLNTNNKWLKFIVQ